MMKNIFLYLKALVTDTFGIMFVLLDILGLILFFVPTLSKVIETYFPIAKEIGIWVLVLLFLIANVRIYLKLAAQISHLTKELKPKIEITIENVSGYDEVYANVPLTEWAIKFKVANRSDDSIFFSGGEAILFFRKSNFSLLNFVLSKFSKDRTLDFILKFSIPIYYKGLTISTNAYRPEDFIQELWNSPDNNSSHLAVIKNIFVCNWEVKKPIVFVPHQEARGPDAKSVQLWTVYGKFPQDLGQKLHSAGYHLSHIAIQFETDQGTFIVSNNQIPLRSVDEAFAQHLKRIETNAKSHFAEIFKNMSLRPIKVQTPTFKSSVYDISDVAKTMRVLPADYQTWEKPNGLEGKSTKHFEEE